MIELLEDKIGLEVGGPHALIDNHPVSVKNLQDETNVSCIVIFTEAEDAERGEAIYQYWRTFFPDVPIVWCHGEAGDDLYGQKWKQVSWCDTNDDEKPLTTLLQLINAAVD